MPLLLTLSLRTFHLNVSNVLRSAKFPIFSASRVTKDELYMNFCRFSHISREEIPKDDSGLFRRDLENSADFTSVHWEELSKKLICQYRLKGVHVTENNVEGVIMSHCVKWNLKNIGHKFYNYLKSKNKEVHVGISSKYLKLCTTNGVEDNDSQMFTNIYKEIRSREVLDPQTAEICLIASSNFKEYWREGINLLEEMKKMSSPGVSAFSALIAAGFRFGEPDLAWTLWQELCDLEKKPSPKVFMAYVDYCEALLNGGKFSPKNIEGLFEMCHKHDLLIPSLESAIKLQTFVKKTLNWDVHLTKVNRHTGVCAKCKHKLEPLQLSDDEFLELKSAVFKKAVVGSNVFLKTNPMEIERFYNFLDSLESYDIVVDGLNVAYRSQYKDPAMLALRVRKVVENFLDRSWKVVVLGRRHMQKWHKGHMKFIFNNANVFLTANISHDDPFLLYATLHGGPNTHFLSDDYMRSHSFLMREPRLKLLFRRWQMAHQFKVNYITAAGKTDILGPVQFLPSAQRSSRQDGVRWHVPYDPIYMDMPPTTLECPEHWMCVRQDKG